MSENISDKLIKVLEHYLSLHDATKLHNLIMTDPHTEKNCINYIKECESNNKYILSNSQCRLAETLATKFKNDVAAIRYYKKKWHLAVGCTITKEYSNGQSEIIWRKIK